MSWFKRILLGSVTLGVGVVIGVFGPELINEIEEPEIWTPRDSYEGIQLGMSRKDLLFTVDHLVCEDDEIEKSECDVLFYTRGKPWSTENNVPLRGKVFLNNDKVSKLEMYDTKDPLNDVFGSMVDYVPYETVEDLIEQWGEPDILSISESLTRRFYTYVEEGIVFDFSSNDLQMVILGDIDLVDTVNWNLEWDKIGLPEFKDEILWINSFSEYLVKGKNLCVTIESPECPFVPKKSVKEEFKNSKPKDLL